MGKKDGRRERRTLVELKFHQAIYPEKALEETMRAYREFAHFELRTDGHYFLLSLKNKSDLEDELLKDEISNYALGLAKSFSLPG